MNYTEALEQLERIKGKLRERIAEETKTTEKGKKAPKWKPEELTELLSDITDLIVGINFAVAERMRKIERKLKDYE